MLEMVSAFEKASGKVIDIRLFLDTGNLVLVRFTRALGWKLTFGLCTFYHRKFHCNMLVGALVIPVRFMLQRKKQRRSSAGGDSFSSN